MCTQVPTVVPEAKQALAEGCAVVIGLQTTGEAAADAMGLEPGQACGWVSTTREMLSRFIQTHFPLLRETAKTSASSVLVSITAPASAVLATEGHFAKHGRCKFLGGKGSLCIRAYDGV